MIRPNNSVLKGEAQKPDSFENYVLSNALNKPVALDSAPTTGNNQLPKDGDIGWVGSSIYIRLGATIRKIDFTNV